MAVRAYEVKEVSFHQLPAESFCIKSAFSQNAVCIYPYIGAHLCQVPDQFQVTPEVVAAFYMCDDGAVAYDDKAAEAVFYVAVFCIS